MEFHSKICVHSYFTLLFISQSFSVVVTPYCTVELKRRECLCLVLEWNSLKCRGKRQQVVQSEGEERGSEVLLVKHAVGYRLSLYESVWFTEKVKVLQSRPESVRKIDNFVFEFDGFFFLFFRLTIHLYLFILKQIQCDEGLRGLE